jgi:hypothetical protein
VRLDLGLCQDKLHLLAFRKTVLRSGRLLPNWRSPAVDVVVVATVVAVLPRTVTVIAITAIPTVTTAAAAAATTGD